MAQQIKLQSFPHLINCNEYSEFSNKSHLFHVSGEQLTYCKNSQDDPCAEIKN